MVPGHGVRRGHDPVDDVREEADQRVGVRRGPHEAAVDGRSVTEGYEDQPRPAVEPLGAGGDGADPGPWSDDLERWANTLLSAADALLMGRETYGNFARGPLRTATRTAVSPDMTPF
jgi:hypothetical protein